MSERILTLFGEEFFSEPPKPAPKPRARKKSDDEKAPENMPVETQAEQRVEEPPAITEAVTSVPQEETIQASTAVDKSEIPTEQANKEQDEKSFELPEDWKGDKQYYTIGEVAKLFNVKTSHIRFWTNEFKLKVRTTRKGDRLYTPDQVRELRAINHLVKERGFTLTGAKAKLKTQKKRDVETVDLKTSLQQLRSRLVIIRNKLNA